MAGPPIVSDQAAVERPAAAPWVLCLPLVLMLSYALALRGLREQPANIGTLIMLLAPLGVLVSTPKRWSTDRHARVHAVLVAGWTLWTAALIPLHPAYAAMGMGWLAVTCAAAVLFIAVTQAGPASRARGDACLLASAVACGLALVVCAIDGPWVGFLDFGFSNINHAICAFDAPLWAGAVLIVGRLAARSAPARARPLIVACVALGIAAELWMCLASPIGIRRGGIVGALAAAACALASWGWRRHRLATILACYLAACALCAGVVVARVPQEFTAPVPSFRYSRVGLYRACLERTAEVQPLGDGAYAVVRVPLSTGEDARHWTAAGNWLLGAHNEVIDALGDGGIPALALWLALAISLTVKAWRIEDPAQRAACAALLAVLFVHAMTDNAYAVPSVRVLMALPCALVFCCPSRGAASRGAAAPREASAARIHLGPLLLAVPLAAVSLVAAVAEFPAALVSIDASPRVHLSVLERSAMPQSMIDEFSFTAQPLCEGARLALARREPQRLQADLQALRYTLDTVERRLGMVARVPYIAATCAQLVLDADLDANAPQESLDHDGADAVRALLAVIRANPFDAISYQQLSAVLAKEGAGRALVPDGIERRCRYLVGAPGIEEPPLTDAPRSLDEAADRYAALFWWTSSGRPLDQAASAIRQLVLAYGDISQVSELGVRLIVRSSGDGEDLVRALDPAMRIGFKVATQPDHQLDEVYASLQREHPQPAAALLRHFYPQVWAGVTAGRYRVARDESPAIAIACGQVYAALRAAERPAAR